MTIAITTQASEEPKDLPPSDFGFDIEYDTEEGPARRVFGATYRFIEACESCCRALLGSIGGVSIEPVIVLENVVTGSIRTRFKVFWREEGEEVMKSGDFWRIISTFLVEGIKVVVRRTNKDEEHPYLVTMQSDLHQLAKGVDLNSLAPTAPISLETLIEIIRQYESVKELLATGDRAELVLPDQSKVTIDQSVIADIEKLKEEATRETRPHHDPGMILIVRKPDYLANSQWVFHYDGKNLAAAIEDIEWLKKFQQRKIDTRPGDALQCQVRIEVAYGYDSRVISKKYYIEKILKVIERGIEGAE